jgi:uncharacterized membrane protein YbhN (UPF0104 family)
MMAETVEGRPLGIKENIFSLRGLIGLAVAAAVIYLFLKNFDLKVAAEAISRAKWHFFLLAFVIYYSSLPLRGGRWGVFLRPAGHSIDSRPLTRYYFLAWFANALLPARIGDLYRAYLLKKNKDVPVSLSLGVLFSERVFDLMVTAGLVAFSGFYFWSILRGSSERDYIIFGLMAVMLVIVVFIALVAGLPYLVRLIPQSWRGRVKLFRSGLFRSTSLLPLALSMTLLIWLSEALRLYFVFLAFGIEAGFMVALFISQAALIVMAIPLSPAGLGLVEILMLKILASTGLTSDMAGALTIVDRLISYWSLLALGGIGYLTSARIR